MIKRVGLILGLILAGVAAVYLGQEYRKAQAAPAEIAQGFTEINSAAEAQNNELQTQNVQLSMDIVDDLRSTGNTAKPAELQEYIARFKWAKTQLPPDSPMHKQLDRDIAWCEKKLKK